MKPLTTKIILDENATPQLQINCESHINKNVLKEATSVYFKKKLPHSKYKYDYSEKEYDGVYRIEVFGYNHQQYADDLHKALMDSGFLEKHPIFSIRIDTMDGYSPTKKI